MFQKLYIPKSGLLQQVINFFFYVEFGGEDTSEEWLSIFPNVTTNMIICLDNKLEFHDGHKNDGVSVACTSVSDLRITSKLRFVQVQFKPFGIFSIKGIPMTDLLNSLLGLEVLFKASECERIKDQLSNAKSLDEMFDELERFMSVRLKTIEIDNRLPSSIILLDQSSLSLDQISKEISLSSRGFRKLFTTQVGLSPGFYKKISRFNKAAYQISMSPNEPLTAIALNNGYYDQSHFIKDFRQFSGISPKTYKRLMAASTDFYNYRSPSSGSFG